MSLHACAPYAPTSSMCPTVYCPQRVDGLKKTQPCVSLIKTSSKSARVQRCPSADQPITVLNGRCLIISRMMAPHIMPSHAPPILRCWLPLYTMQLMVSLMVALCRVCSNPTERVCAWVHKHMQQSESPTCCLADC